MIGASIFGCTNALGSSLLQFSSQRAELSGENSKTLPSRHKLLENTQIYINDF